MLFHEIALSGLRGLPEVRLGPKKGVNIVHIKPPEQRAQLIDGIFFALHVDAGTGASLVDGSGASRAAIAVQGKDGHLYRILRDFASGGARLLKRGTDPSEWSTLSADLAEISQFVRVQLHVPSHQTYERLYVLGPGRLIGRGPAAQSRAGGALWPPVDVLGTPGSAGTSPGFPSFPASPFGGTSPGLAPASPFASSPGLGGNLGFGTAGGGGAPLMRMPSALQPSPVFAAPSPAFVTDDNEDEPPPASPQHVSSGFHNPMNALARTEAEPPRAFDVAAAKREHARLARHLEIVTGSQGMHAELDRLLRYRDGLKERVGEVQAAQRAADDARAEAAQYKHLDDVPPGTGDRIKDIEASDARKSKEMERIDQERQDMENAASKAAPKPLREDPMFLAGLGVIALSVLLAVIFERTWILALNLVGALVAASAALAYVSQIEKQARLGVRLSGLTEREARALRQHELETGVVRKLLKQLDIEDANQLLAELEAASAASAERAAAEHMVAQLESDPARRAELEDLKRVEARIDQIEAQLATLDGSEDGGASVNEIERRLSALTKDLAAKGVDITNPSQGDSGDGGYFTSSYSGGRDDDDARGGLYAPGADDEERYAATGWGGSKTRSSFGGGEDGGPPPEDGSAALGAALADVVHRPTQALAQALLPRLSQYLKAFTGGAFTGAEVGPSGEIRVKADGASGSSPIGGVEPSMARAVEAAVHLAWLEAALTRVAMPVLVDDPFIGLNASARKLIGQAFKYMGDRTQVIIFTSESDMPGSPIGS